MDTGNVVVVGAGVGGLVAAALLARRGVAVTVLERDVAPGGKLVQAEVGGRRIDAGPTVLTMRWVFDEIFEELGLDLSAFLELVPARVLARHAWGDGSRLDLFADRARSAEAIGDFAGRSAARGYLSFAAEAERIYRALEGPYLRAARPNVGQLVGRMGVGALPDLWRLQPFTPMWRELGRYFTDIRLRQLFARYATYCGSSPFQAPSTLMLVAAVEQAGVWLVTGDMVRLADALVRAGRSLGVDYRYGSEVAEIETADRRVTGVRLASGERIPAGSVVYNGDAAALSAGLLGPAVRAAPDPDAPGQRSQSAITWAMLAEPADFPLARHTVFFSADYAAEFADVFERGRAPREPTVYVCAEDRDDAGNRTGNGPERLLCLVNAPANGDRVTLDRQEIRRCEEQMAAQLARCGLRLNPCQPMAAPTTPSDFHRRYPGTGGALYGRASHGWMASFQRPGSRTRVQGLFLAGGSAHPGPGVPMAALSGRLAATAILAQSASRRTSLPVATPGGTSTASATTAGTRSR